MNEEQKQMAIMGGIVVLLLFSMFIICLGGNKKSNKVISNIEFAEVKQEEKSLKDRIKQKKKVKAVSSSKTSNSTSSSYSNSIPNGSSASSNYSYNYSESSQRIDKDLVERIRIAKEKARKEQQDYIHTKIKKILKDPKAPLALKIRAQLMTDQNYLDAFFAYKQSDYNGAVENYYKLVKGKKYSPQIKYLALKEIEKCAKKTGNIKLFIESMKASSELATKEDLTVFSVHKNTSDLRWIEKFEKYMLARDNNEYRKRLIEENMNKYSVTKEYAEKEINREIKTFEAFFPEFAI